MMLIADKKFERISVQEICDRAMVHRTTFYKHYEDKYDLLQRGTQEMLFPFLILISKDK